MTTSCAIHQGEGKVDPGGLERLWSASSSLSSGSSAHVPSGTSVGVEQTACVELISHGSVAHPKSCRSEATSHLMVLGTDRVLLYTEGNELQDWGEQATAGVSSVSFSSRPGTAGSESSRSSRALVPSLSSLPLLPSLSSPMKQVQVRGRDQARTPSISLTARVGSAGELVLPSQSGAEWSDDEDQAPELGGRGDYAASTKCRVAVSLNQLVDAVAVDGPEGDTLLVIYCPSTNKLNDPTSLRARTSQLSKSFRRGLLSKSSRSRRLPKEILQQVPGDSYHFYVQFASAEAAESMRMAVLGQARKFYECIVWLSKQFPMPQCQSSIMMVTCGRRDGPQGARDGRHGRHGAMRDTHASAFTRAFPALGEEIGLPREVSHGLCALARGDDEQWCAPSPLVTTFYIQTPLGMATAEVGLLDLEQSWVDGSAPVEVVGELREETCEDDTDGEYRWQVTMAFRVTRGDTVVGKYVDGDETTHLGGDAARAAQSQPRAVQRKVSHGLGAPLVVSLVALRAAKGVVRSIKGRSGKKEGKKKGGHAAKSRRPEPDRKISPKNLHDWSIAVLGIDISLEPRTRRANTATRKVSMTHCQLDDTHAPSVDLPRSILTLMDRHSGVVTPDIATRFMMGLDSETKAYTGLVKMIEFWDEHGLGDLRPNRAAFSSMKKHYPHGVIGWSEKSDCLITYEAMGLWPEAYKRVIQDGNSEEDILHHMLVCYLFNFRELDSRAWPDGKAVKIMDLDGLRLGHINTAGFKFITSIANVLAIMFPQRMHQCIFINAPSFWNIAWSVMKNVVPEKVRSQMQVFNRGSRDKAREALLEYLDECELDVLFPEPQLENPYETRLLEYILA